MIVQDQNLGLTIERLEDLDTLLHANAQIFDQGIGINVELIFFSERL